MVAVSKHTRVVIWRHGETDWNRASRFQGRTDIAMNALGFEQARRAAPALAAMAPTALYSSPLQRAHATALELAALTDLQIVVEERLAEINVGDWAGRTIAEVHAEFPEVAEAMKARRDFRRSSTGETSAECSRRLGAALRDIGAAHPGQTVVVVTHGLAIRMGIADVVGWDYSTAMGLGPVSNCSWSMLEDDRSGWRLARYNVPAYVEH